jgi:hypothetical protein
LTILQNEKLAGVWVRHPFQIKNDDCLRIAVIQILVLARMRIAALFIARPALVFAAFSGGAGRATDGKVIFLGWDDG